MSDINGKAIAEQYKAYAAKEAAKLAEKWRKPKLAVVHVGDDPASKIYIRNKKRACEQAGIEFSEVIVDGTEEGISDALKNAIFALNNNRSVDGILVQLPLPPFVNVNEILSLISPDKDVDGFHPENAGRLMIGDPGFIPCTPMGIVALLKMSGVELAGKNAVVIGRSNIVGKPVASLLLQEDCTVTVCHSHTSNLKEAVRGADIVIAALGNPGFITADMIKEGAVVIDVGINRTENGIVGDVDYENVSKVASLITPVPGGVGPMTVAMLLLNVVRAAENHKKQEQWQDEHITVSKMIEKLKNMPQDEVVVFMDGMPIEDVFLSPCRTIQGLYEVVVS